jgi:glycine C-acetyltransferase
MKIHMELEDKIARFKNVEECVLFRSGFTTNARRVSGILENKSNPDQSRLPD